MAAPQLVSDPTAVFGRRVVATLVDGAIVFVPTVAAVTAQFEYLTLDQLGGVDPQQYCDDYMQQRQGVCVNTAEVNDRVYFNDGGMTGGGLVFWGLGFLLLVVLQGITGWSIGKLLTGIRVVRADGRPPGIGKALVRWLLWVVDGQPCGLPLVGFITGLTTTGHRRVGDMVAKTFVVRASAAGTPVSVPGLTAPPPSPVVTYANAPWTGPGPSSPSPSLSPPSAPTPTAADPAGPQWDAARNTYIQWDPSQSRWLQWDEVARTWSPIPDQ